MSSGGVFTLIANDGKADKMIMATDLLNQRIKDITCMRAKEGLQDPTPTLVDIEKTHVLFVNAHFKPFAAIGYEYSKTRSQSGSASYGESVTFSIPQFGDFFNDMVVHVQLAAIAANSVSWTPEYPTEVNGVALTTGAANVAAGVTGSAERYEYQFVNAAGVVQAASTQTDFVRYCEYPGERLFKRVEFNVNGNPLDDYNNDITMMHRKFRVAPGKLNGWKRLMGQEVPKDGYTPLCIVANTSNFGAAAVSSEVGLPFGTSQVAPLTSQSSNDGARKLVQVVDGPQTPKAQQPQLEMWIPLLFWYNLDARLSIPSVSIPYGQRFITVEFEQQANIVYSAPGNLYLQLTTDVVTGTGAGNWDTLTNVTNWTRCVTRSPALAGSTLPTQSITKAELYINNIFVNPEIHDIYIKRIGFSLIRVHRFQRKELSTAGNNELLSNLKWPIETMYLGVRPKFNTDNSANANAWRDWHHLTRLVDKVCEEANSNVVLAQDPTAANVTGAITDTFVTAGTSQRNLVNSVGRTFFSESLHTVKRLTVLAHGIYLYNDFPSEFFAAYIPWQYGGYNIVVPDDEGALMVNFCLYPGTYQPSGHVNVSRAREFYVNFTSDYVGVDVSAITGVSSENGSQIAVLLVVASAINFLLISDGSAVLRYST